MFFQTVTWVLGWLGGTGSTVSKSIGRSVLFLVKMAIPIAIVIFGIMNGLFEAAFESAWLTFVSAFPDEIQTDLNQFADIMAVANAWQPIAEYVVIIMAYFTFLAAFIIFKFTFKAIPTVG